MSYKLHADIQYRLPLYALEAMDKAVLYKRLEQQLMHLYAHRLRRDTDVAFQLVLQAVLLQKHSTVNIGTALFLVDLSITVAAFFIFDIQTGMFSFCGLMAKSLVIDSAIENINLCKYFTIVCDNPEPICEFIHVNLDRSATIFQADGTFTHHRKYVILTVMKRGQAVQLRNFIRQIEPHAFLMITNSSEIIGKGFRGLN